MEKISSGTLTPAYGRDYKSAKSFAIDLFEGKDFYINTHLTKALCSIRDLQPGAKLQIRYNKLKSTAIIIIPS